MAKQRKTREQKVRSDKRQEHVLAKPSETSPQPQAETAAHYRFTSDTAAPLSTKEQKISTTNSHEYDYVKHDLLKTGLVTGSIIIAQLILFFVIH